MRWGSAIYISFSRLFLLEQNSVIRAQRKVMDKSHSWLKARWMAGIALMLLVAAHLSGISILRHKPAMAVGAGIVLLPVITHMGILGPVYALFRRRSGK